MFASVPSGCRIAIGAISPLLGVKILTKPEVIVECWPLDHIR